MEPISYQRHHFLPTIIRHAVWPYFRFTLSLRDVEDLLAERGIKVSYEAIGTWTQKFGAQFAQNLQSSHSKPTGRWHLDERVVRIKKRMLLWQAVDEEGEVLDVLALKRGNKQAAATRLRKVLKRHGMWPEAIVTDKLASYGAAAKEPSLSDRHQPTSLPANNRA